MRDQNLEISLLFMRITVFVVMLVWTLDKFMNPEHAVAVYEKFYFIGGLGAAASYTIGAVELAILVGFVVGAFKPVTYGLVLAFHAVSTLSAWHVYLAPYDGPNLLFFAAWPMLAACVALFLMRDRDQLMSVS